MLYVFLAVLGVALVAVGIYLPRTGKDVIAERLAAFHHRARSLEEIELQQPFSERVVRPFIRQLADAMGRFQQARSKNPRQLLKRRVGRIALHLIIRPVLHASKVSGR